MTTLPPMELVADMRREIACANIEADAASDNFAIALCTIFTDHHERPEDDEEGDRGWGEWVEARANAALEIAAKEAARVAERYAQQVAAAKDAELAAVIAERDALRARVADEDDALASAGKAVQEASNLLRTVRLAIGRLGLRDRGSDLSLPHEVRMVALAFNYEGREGPGELQVKGTGEARQCETDLWEAQKTISRLRALPAAPQHEGENNG